MKLLEKIKSFFCSLLGLKESESATHVSNSDSNEENHECDWKALCEAYYGSTSDAKEKAVKSDIKSDKDNCDWNALCEAYYGPTTGTEEETPKKKIIPFDDTDKEAIVNILRPVIKSINSDELYASVCSALLQSRVLKTYATLSEDKKTLTICLTQNKFFNEQLSDFVASHVVSLFKSSIDAEFLGKYEVTAVGGSIVITKVG